MVVQCELGPLRPCAGLRAFLSAGAGGAVQALEREAAYARIGRTLVRFRYFDLSRAGQGLARRCLLSAETDRAPGRCWGLRRGWEMHCSRLARLSNGHLHNLRRSRTCELQRAAEQTKPAQAGGARRRKLRLEGRPKCARVDTVHQGNLDGRKGVRRINAVDAAAQFQQVNCAEPLSEMHLPPVLRELSGDRGAAHGFRPGTRHGCVRSAEVLWAYLNQPRPCPHGGLPPAGVADPVSKSSPTDAAPRPVSAGAQASGR